MCKIITITLVLAKKKFVYVTMMTMTTRFSVAIRRDKRKRLLNTILR